MKTPALRVDGLRKEFGGLVAVKDVSFDVQEGEFIGLIGPNGCGKSTTFNCISGLLEQTEGKVEVFGTDVSMMRPDQIQNLGMTRTFQHTRLWREMTVIENLLVPPRNQFSPSFLDVVRSGRSHPAEVNRLDRAFEVLDQLCELERIVALKWARPDNGVPYMKGVARYAERLHRDFAEELRPTPPEALLAAIRTTDRNGYNPDRARDLAEAIGRLPPEQADALMLRLAAGLDLAAIARVTGVSPETAKSRLRYAVGKLKQSLGDDDEH